MRTSLLIPLIGGLAAGVFAAYSLSSSKGDKKDDAPLVRIPVVVASSEIPYAAEITADMLSTVEFVESNPLLLTSSETDSLVGRVTASRIVSGAPVLGNMLAPEGTLPGALYQVPHGYTPTPVVVPRYTVQHVEPGDLVDVSWAIKTQARGARPRKSQPLFERIEVFSIGDRRKGEPVEGEGESGGQARRRTASSGSGTISVALLLTRKQAELFRTAQMHGDFILLPRSVNDMTPYADADIDFEKLFNLQAQEEELTDPVEEPVRRIKVIRGGKETSVPLGVHVPKRRGASASRPYSSNSADEMLKLLNKRARLASEKKKNGD